MKHIKLKMLADEFIKELQDLNEKANTEDEMDELTEITIDLLDKIPITLVQKDYYTREFIRRFLPKEKREDNKLVDKLMNRCYERDIVFLYDEEFSSNINEIIKQITEE